MAFTYTIKVFCTVENTFKLVTQNNLVSLPTLCPNGHAIDSDKTVVSSTVEDTFISSTSLEFTSLSVFQTIPNCSLIPSEGKWDVILSCAAETTQGTDPETELALAIDDTIIPDTVRELGSYVSAAALLGAEASGFIAVPVSIKTRVTVDGTQEIRPKFRRVTSGGGIQVEQRSLTIIKVVEK